MELVVNRPSRPTTTRGYPSSIDVHGSKVLFCSGTIVAIASFPDFAEVDVYREHSAPTSVAKFSPTGNLVASGDIKGNLKVWWADNPTHPIRYEVQALAGPIRDISWSADSQRLVYVGEGASVGKVIMSDSGNSLGDIVNHSRPALTCAFRPDRPFKVVTGGEDGQINYFAGPPFRYDKSLHSHSNYVNKLVFSPDSKHFLSASSDRKVCVYDALTTELKHTLVGHDGSVLGADWLSNELIVTCGADKAVKVWSGETAVWSGSVGSTVDDMQVAVRTVTSETFLSLTLGGELILWSMNESQPLQVYRSNSNPCKWLASTGRYLFTAEGFGTVCIRHNWTATDVHVVKRAVPIVSAKAYRDQVAIVWIDGHLEVYRENAKETEVELEAEAVDLAWEFGGSRIAVACADSTVKIISGTSTRSLQTPGVPGKVSWGGHKLFVSDESNAINATSDLETWTVVLSHTHTVSVLEISPNGELLAVGDSNRYVTILTTAEGLVQHSWPFHSSLVSSIAWHSGNNVLVSSSVDKSIIVWSIAKGGPLATMLDTHRLGVNAVTFIEADLRSTVVSAGADGVLRFWNCSLA